VSDADDSARIAIAALSPAEREAGVLYLDDAIRPAGPCRLGRTSVVLARPSRIAFLDPTPRANWEHPCRYLVIAAEDGALTTHADTAPPFLRGAAPSLRAIARGPAVPDWTLAAPFRPPP
jgi:hypothetical protein